MVNRTSIKWCDFTANPIRYRDAAGKSVWACVKASAGCQHCYAEALAHRYQGREFTAKAMEGVTPYVDERALKAMLSPTKLPAGSKVFVGDMTDMFGSWVPFELMDRVFAVFALRPDVVFQVLTKRPERMREYACDSTRRQRVGSGYAATGRSDWPLPNVWLGVSAENQHWADVRIPELLATPAAVRFVSAEPLLGPVDFEPWVMQECRRCARRGAYTDGTETEYWCQRCGEEDNPVRPKLDWVIVGGESGPGARPCDVGWIRRIVGQCRAAGVAVFVKQLGARPVTACASHGVSCGGHRWPWNENEAQALGKEPRPKLKSRKGGDPGEWPEDLRVREWPQ